MIQAWNAPAAASQVCDADCAGMSRASHALAYVLDCCALWGLLSEVQGQRWAVRELSLQAKQADGSPIAECVSKSGFSPWTRQLLQQSPRSAAENMLHTTVTGIACKRLQICLACSGVVFPFCCNPCISGRSTDLCCFQASRTVAGCSTAALTCVRVGGDRCCQAHARGSSPSGADSQG